MSEVHPVQPGWGTLDVAGLAALHRAHDADPEAFWREQAGRLDWVRPPTRIKDVSYDLQDFRIRWFEDGTLNVSANCLDRHLASRASQTRGIARFSWSSATAWNSRRAMSFCPFR